MRPPLSISLTLSFFALPAIAPRASAQTTDMSSRRWCADSGTACWQDPRSRDWFNGVRILADIDLSTLFQPGKNRFENNFQGRPKIALEFIVYRSWVAF